MITPLPWQQSVLDSPSFVNVIAAGRRAGKSMTAAMVAVKHAREGKIVFLGCLAIDMFQYLKEVAPDIKINKITNQAWFKDGGRIYKGLGVERWQRRAIKFDVFIFDEFILLNKIVSSEAYLTDPRPRYYFSTPDFDPTESSKAFNHLYFSVVGLPERGSAWKIPSHMGSSGEEFYQAVSRGQLRREYGEQLFKQEFLAEFIDA